MSNHTLRLTKYIFLIFLITKPLSFVNGQSYKFKSFTKQDGISSAHVRKIIKDEKGFVWLSTDEGLNRFDGHSFFSFRHKENDELSLANDRCNALLLDKYCRLWVNTDDGISQFNEKSQTFTNYFPDSSLVNVMSSSLGNMYETTDDKIWICGQFEILIFDMKTKTFTVSGWYKYAKKNGIIKRELRNNISSSIYKKSDHELWLLTVYGLFSVNLINNEFRYYPNDSQNVVDYFAYYIDHKNENYLWISTYDNHFYTFDLQTFNWRHHVEDHFKNPVPKYIQNIRPLNKDTLLLLGNSVLYYYSISQDRLFKFDDANFTNENIQKYELLDGMIYTVKYNGIIETIQSYQPWYTKQIIAKPNHENISRYLHSENGPIVYLGNWDSENIYCYDYVKKTTKQLKDDHNKDIKGTLQNYIKIDEKYAYMSTDQDVFLLDESIMKATQLKKSNCNAEQFEFRNFVIDQHGNYYIRDRFHGLFVLDQKTKDLKLLTPKITDNEYGALVYDSLNDRFLMSVDHKGVYIFSKDGEILKHYPMYVEPIHRMAYVNDMQCTSNGIAIMTEPGMGLIVLDTKIDQMERISKAYGLPSLEVRYISMDKYGQSWISSDKGLILYNKDNLQFTLYGSDSEDLSFFDRMFQTNDGLLASISSKGDLIIKNNDSSSLDNYAGQLYLKQIKILGEPESISYEYILPYNRNDIEMQFGFLDFESLEMPIMEYKINEQDWRKMDQQLTFNFLNLQPAEYYIEIREKYNPNNKINFKISIKKPWWNSNYFYLAMIIAFIILFTLWYRYKIKNLQEKESQKREIQLKIAKLEMNALKAQMNPHFIFNCLNSINRYILINDTENASDYLTKFSRLIRSVLEISKSELISLDTELHTLNLYIAMESMRFIDSFEYKLDVDPSINLHDCLIPPLLLQPFVENAIWHGLMQKQSGIKSLNISISQIHPDEILITILDNGVGRMKAAELKSKELNNHKSFGMQITQDRLNLFTLVGNKSNTITIDDLYEKNQPIGTKISITLHM